MADVQLTGLSGSVKTAYEANADTNAFTDAQETSVNAIVEVFTTAEQTKLSGIETAADVTDSANVLSSLVGQDIVSDSVTAQVAQNAQTGTTYTLVIGDASEGVTMDNASANTLTVPPNSSVAFAVGTVIMLGQLGAGQTTIAEGAGVTIDTSQTLKLRTENSIGGLWKVATDTWQLFGDLEAA